MNRLTLRLIGLMLFPALSVGGILLATAWLACSPENWAQLWRHWMSFLLLAMVCLGCIAAAAAMSANILRQTMLLTNAVEAINLGKTPAQFAPQHLYRELQPVYAQLKNYAAFQDESMRTLAAIVRGSPESVLTLRSDDDEFIRLVNALSAHLRCLQQMTTAVAEGNLAGLPPLEEAGPEPEQHLQGMVAKLREFVSKGRNYTNHIVQAGSQINSITTQEFQDTKIVTKRVNEISQSIYQMATNIQSVAGHLQEQTNLLGDTSASIEQTMHSIEEIANNVTHLKAIVEKNTPSFLASEKTGLSLDLLYEATKSIEHDANTCVHCSQEAAAEAEQGKLAVQQTIAGISQIQATMTEFFEIVRRLGERAEEVNEILEAISDIADHTNLLAINAAIISAHAGEHGRDFAVIADEIGKFAERTHESTNEIGELLSAIRSEFTAVGRVMEKSSNAVSQGVELSDQAGKTLAKIAGSIFSTKEIVAKIAAATTDQARENEHIRDIMRELVLAQKEGQEQVNRILWQLMQTIAQIRGISSEQAEGNARLTEMTTNFKRITREIGQATTHHVDTANEIIMAVDDIRKLVQRMTLGTEKTTQLTNELFMQGGNLAIIMGEFGLSARTPLENLAAEVPLIGFVKRGPDTFFDYMAAGIRAAVEKSGCRLLETNSRYEATMQVEDVNWLLQQPLLQGIILCPVDRQVARKLVQKSIDQGKPCIAADESIPATISVRSGNREGGQRAAEILIEHLPPNVSVGVFVDRTVESMVRRAQGFQERASLYPLKIVEIYCDLANPVQREDYIVAGLKENAELKGLFLTNEGVTTAYLHALHAGALPASNLLAVGFDDTPLAEEAIRKGELLGAIFQHPEEIGQQAFQWLARLIRKEISLETIAERTIYIPTVKVTQKTLQSELK